ncbi:MAG: (2Fe-2S) ferredoxin domain-containing protein [Deltaproteobacteria bacterium]|nr:(2Fe-2S) ferredoxin domain-containing protein [Candidatus Zymogenaceae bacterium]
MSPISADQLRKIKLKIQNENALRYGVGRAKVTVHMGTCGIASGARDVLESLLVDIAQYKATDVIVAVDDCVGLCEREPLVTILKPGQKPIEYEKMNPDKMRHVFKEHFIVTEIQEPVEGESGQSNEGKRSQSN